MASRRCGTAIDSAFSPIKLQVCHITIENVKLHRCLDPVTLVVYDGAHEIIRLYAQKYNDIWVTFPTNVREFTKGFTITLYHDTNLTLEGLIGKAIIDVHTNTDCEAIVLSLGTGIGSVTVRTNVKRLLPSYRSFPKSFSAPPNTPTVPSVPSVPTEPSFPLPLTTDQSPPLVDPFQQTVETTSDGLNNFVHYFS